jgi:hypothetical protein
MARVYADPDRLYTRKLITVVTLFRRGWCGKALFWAQRKSML